MKIPSAMKNQFWLGLIKAVEKERIFLIESNTWLNLKLEWKKFSFKNRNSRAKILHLNYHTPRKSSNFPNKIKLKIKLSNQFLNHFEKINFLLKLCYKIKYKGKQRKKKLLLLCNYALPVFALTFLSSTPIFTCVYFME